MIVQLFASRCDEFIIVTEYCHVFKGIAYTITIVLNPTLALNQFLFNKKALTTDHFSDFFTIFK